MDVSSSGGKMLRAAVIGVGFVGPHHADAIRRTGYVWTPLVEAQLADLSALAELARRIRFDGGSVTDALPLSPFPALAAHQALLRAFAQLAGEL